MDRITPSYTCNDIGILEPSSPVLIEIVGTAPYFSLSVSQEVGDKRQSTSPGLVTQSQKLDAVIHVKLSDYHDLASIFIKVIIDKLSYSSR